MSQTKRCDNCAHNKSSEPMQGTHCAHPLCSLADPIIWANGNSTPMIYAKWCRGERFAPAD